ncbi:hypothetical protein K458DRAFT_427244 [Lentithecium fluviatile CBS 122367]|uniref:Peptidase S54 rhomboid domain-containing protein n=1 Tax=Lentithecium fluviatile CBS 122367 TaxID=1168545 RepID=A0A6G1JIZ8_9PLEO|nr:hypothetical protein K458DRAFT_427244 [Lentithecium fluviatile CBS 122367]
MSFLRCPRSLLRLPGVPLRVSSTSCVGSISALHRADCQTRSQHTRPSRQTPKRFAPQRKDSQQPSPYQNRKAIKPDIVFEARTKKDHPEEEEDREFHEAKVFFLRPAVFVLSASSIIYISLAYLEAKKELEPRRGTSIDDFVPQWQLPRRTPPTPTEVVTRAWNELSPMSKLSWGLIATNGTVHLTKFVVPRLWAGLWHVPAVNANYSLFTSMFVHSGLMHFGANMYGCYNFIPPVGHSKLFREDTNHMMSFFLATGLLTGWAQHVAAAVFTRGRAYPPMFIPSGGASGALFAILGAFCMEYPNHGIGFILLPFRADASTVLPAVMLFDLIGMVRGYSFVNFGHAAHLGGASLGVAYSYFDGHDKLWRPLVDFWKRRLLRNRAK